MAKLLHQRLKALRQTREYTQGQLATYSHVSASLISLMETGKRLNPTAEVLSALASTLKTTTDYLLGLTANPWPRENPGLNEEESRLITFFRAMHEDQRGMVLMCSEWLAQKFK